jgi:kynureninase
VPTPTDADRRGGMVCVDLPDPERLVDALAEEGIDVDARPGAGVRIGPHPCLHDEECDRLVERILR